MQFLFKIDSIPYGFLVIFGFYGLSFITIQSAISITEPMNHQRQNL